MTIHVQHPGTDDREEFLVDGCPRCAEYVADLGVQFDAARFRAFWAKMLEVEIDGTGCYASKADKELGSRLYLVALQLERAFALDLRAFEAWATMPRSIITFTDPS